MVSLQHVLYYAMCYYRGTIGIPQRIPAASHGYKIARQFTTLRFLKAGPRQILLPDRTDTDGLRNPHELPQVYETLMSYPKESVSRIVCRFKIYLKDYFM